MDFTTKVVITPMLVNPVGPSNRGSHDEGNQVKVPGFEFKATVANGDIFTLRTPAADLETARTQIQSELDGIKAAVTSAQQ